MNFELSQIGLYLVFLAAGWVVRHQGWFVPATPPAGSSNHPVLDEIRTLLRQLQDQQARTQPPTTNASPPRQ